MNVRPEQLRLYAVTDRAWSPDTEDFFRRIRWPAIDGGATFVQLREKHMSRENFLDEAQPLCRPLPQPRRREHHQRQRGDCDRGRGPTASTWGRRIWRPARARAAARAGQDHRRLGPQRGGGLARPRRRGPTIWARARPSSRGTKADARPSRRETIRAITDAVDIPVVAIGGITPGEHVRSCAGCGLDGVAVVSALFAQRRTLPGRGRTALRALGRKRRDIRLRHSRCGLSPRHIGGTTLCRANKTVLYARKE